MRGALSETSLADLCRELSASEATGVVDFNSSAGSARLTFRNGDVHAVVASSRTARLGDRLVAGGLLGPDQLAAALVEQRDDAASARLGEVLVARGNVSPDVIRVFLQEQVLDTVLDLVSWPDTSFSFAPDELDGEELPIDLPVHELLAEVARRRAELDRIAVEIPDLEGVPERVPDSATEATLEPEERAVLDSIDGTRSLAELAETLGYSRFELARVTYGLSLLGLVQVGGAPRRAAPDEDAAPAPVELTAALAAVLDEAETEQDEHELGASLLEALDEPTVAPRDGADVDPDAEAGADGSDFDALIDQLAGGRERDQDDLAAGRDPGPGAATRPSEDPRSRDDPAEADVSEFLRELSRLALDDSDRAPSKSPSRPRERETATPAPDTTTDEPGAGDEEPTDADDRRRRGLFGWGR